MPNISKLKMLKVPLEDDYKHTIDFDSLELQQTYFNTRVIKTFDDLSYIKQDSTIVVDMPYNSALGCNYVAYQNIEESDKWFYAFITDHKEISSGEQTELTLDIDPLQTYMFDYEVLKSFVEREHVDSDIIGENTLPENLETGEYICNKINYNKSILRKGIVVASTIDLRGLYANPIPAAIGSYYGGVYSGLAYFYFATPESLNAVLKLVAEKGQNDSIQSVFMTLSDGLQTEAMTLTIDESPVTFYKIVESQSPITKLWSTMNSDTSPEKPYHDINGYIPHNNKLFTYPYCYLLANNAGGGSTIYKYESFKNDPFDFKIAYAITPGISCKMTPLNYGGVEENETEALTLGKLPICAWTSDVYTNWLTQNSVNIGLNFAAGVGQVAAGVGMAIATGGAGIAVGGSQAAAGVSQIAGQLAQIHQQSLIPPAMQGNLNSGDVIFADNKLTFSLCDMSIKAEYAKIIDQYFDMFGYKCNQVKIPNTKHRKYWWYIKTIDVNIKGNVPQKYMEIIKKCYNDGITFWRNTMDSKIKEYQGSNDIV